MIVYYGVIIFIFGLCLGSFLNCMAMRIAKSEDWIKGRSHCMSCGHELSLIDLMPVLSFILSKGRCRYCKEKISKRYIVTEFCFGFLSLLLYLYFLAPSFEDYLHTIVIHAESYEELSILEKIITNTFLCSVIVFFRNLFLTGCLFVASIIDIETRTIPDGCILSGAIGWAITAPFAYGVNSDAFILRIVSERTTIKSELVKVFFWMCSFIGCAIIVTIVILLITLVTESALKKAALGGGDIKLFAMISLYLGFMGSYELVMFSCIVGLISAVIFNKGDIKAEGIPFGPSIAITGYILLFLSKTITEWYFGLF